MKCPKCGYQRLPTDNAPEWQCPSCKVAYIKARAAQPTLPPPQPAPENNQNRVDEEDDLQERQTLASAGQKIVIYCIVLNFVLRAAGQGHVLPDLVIQAYLNIKTTRMLREAGWTVGLFGARP